MNQRVLLFLHGERCMAVPAAAAREAFALREVTPLPGAAPYLMGVTEVSGKLLSLLDFTALSGLSAPAASMGLLLEVAGERLALPVQEVLGFEMIDQALPKEVLSGEFDLAGRATQLINPHALLGHLQSRVGLL